MSQVKSSPMISVILPTYNRETFISEAIRTVLNQSYPNIELIIVDDDSQDNTYNTIHNTFHNIHTQQKKILYLHKQHQGVSAARNLGLQNAKSNWVAFLDSDDLWHKEKLSTQMHILLHSKEYKASYTQEKWIRNGQHLNQSKHHQKYSGYIYTKCLDRCIISPSSFLCHKSVIQNVGLFDENLPACEDYDYWLRLTAQYKIRFLNTPLTIKRGGHENQLSRKYNAIDRFRIHALKKILTSGLLTIQEYGTTRQTLIKKATILMNGATKRQHTLTAQHYQNIIQLYTHSPYNLLQETKGKSYTKLP